MQIIRVLSLAAAAAVLCAPALGATRLRPVKPFTGDSKYRVFCADGKIEVEQRTVEEEKSARGSNVCLLAEFDYASDADAYAEHHGGKGSSCRCD